MSCLYSITIIYDSLIRWKICKIKVFDERQGIARVSKVFVIT